MMHPVIRNAATILAETPDGGPATGWVVAALLAGAWIATAFVRARSRRRLELLLQDENETPREGLDFPLLNGLASHAVRRLRSERERHTRLQDRFSEIERVLRATPIAVLSLDHLQRIVSANPAAERLLGFDERSARGRLMIEVIRQSALNRVVARALAGDGRANEELHLDLDPPLEVQVSCEPLHADAQPPGLVISLVDVTRMRRLESMRSEFAANVSHELRTPITNIKGYVETLLQVGVDEPAQLQKFLEIIHRNTARLSGLVEDILSLAYLEEPEAKQSLVRIPLPAEQVVRQVLEDLESAATAKSIRLSTTVDDTLWILANETLAGQALANLVSNAIKYTPEGSRVSVAVDAEGDLVRFSVQDNGPGIATKHLPRLFERFYRVDKARTRAQGGTGLGLAIVKHIASIHGGRVEVTSRVGEGSCFRLLLPRSVVPSAAEAMPIANESGGAI
jgi:two-component system phosphate regulon sensor histidine kinase PhoR